jgi:two-component system alkaline phosphatase synthesis response regulator PhoP
MARILVVDDEESIIELIGFNLRKEGFEVVTATDGYEAIKEAREASPDLVVLDLMLPGLDGMEICRVLRNGLNKTVPIIMLTARSEEQDRVMGLELGADDYLTKPFSPRELVARIKAVLRRTNATAVDGVGSNSIQAGPIVIDPDRYEVTDGGRRLDLTRKEFELLRVLAGNPGRVLTRDYLLDRVWGYEVGADTRTVDVFIRHLRQKIEPDPANPVLIETVRGIGYRFRGN